jgi:hypothetical protein
MKRLGWIAVVALLVAGACGSGAESEEETSTTSTTRPRTTTTRATTTSTEPTTTTTTTPPAVVTEHPGLPAADDRDQIPWPAVDADWTLALVSGDRFEPAWEDGPRVLYLVDPDGGLYEIRAWPPGDSVPWLIHDWSPDGRRALIGFAGLDGHGSVDLIQLEDGVTTPVLPPRELGDGRAGFTKPTGRDLVLWTSDGTNERLEVVFSDLSQFSVLGEQAHDNMAPLTWLYALEGTTVVVGDRSGLHVRSNDGTPIVDLVTPDAVCRPLKWWRSDLVLASCIPADWVDDNSFYHQLWLVPFDGSDPTSVTWAPAEMPNVVDFGYTDAWQAGDEVFLQWEGDCGAASVDLLLGGAPLLAEDAGPHRVVGTVDSDAILHVWDGCDQSESALLRVAIDGSVLADLIPRVEGMVGVLSAVSMPYSP